MSVLVILRLRRYEIIISFLNDVGCENLQKFGWGTKQVNDAPGGAVARPPQSHQYVQLMLS